MGWLLWSSAIVGAGAILALLGLGELGPMPNNGGSAGELTVGAPKGSHMKVKVAYFQMEQTLDASEEYFLLGSPAYLSNLISLVEEKHPSLVPMLPGMRIFIDGVTAQGMTALADGSEVDLIPVFAGG